MADTFFTSDLHLGHRFVAGLRGFGSDTDAHDYAICAAWQAVVKPRDTVWVLGDIAVSNPKQALTLLSELPGTKHLVWGNHDQGHPMHRDAHLRASKYLGVFASAAQSARRRLPDGREVLLSHLPYDRDRGEQRHNQWRLRDEGALLLHGHTHGAERLTNRNGGPEIHVGVDAWDLRPVSLAQVMALTSESTP